MKRTKHFLFLFLSLFLSFSIASCSDKNDDVIGGEDDIDKLLSITPSQAELQSESVGDSLTFTFTLKGIEASLVKVKSSASWCDPAIFENQEKGKIITQANNTSITRSATITLSYEKTWATFKVTQDSKAMAPDVKDDIKLKVSSGKASAYQSGESVEKSFDNDMSTIYHSTWNASLITPDNPIILTYNFSNVGQMDYLIYYPRTEGSNGNFKKFDLFVSYDNESTYTEIGSYDFKGSSSPSLLSFQTPLENPTNIKFVVAGGVGNFVSCAEMEFYRKSENSAFDYSAYFTDKACSDLKPGITLADINKISDTFFKELALEMYRNTYDKEFRVQEYKQYQYPEVMHESNKIWFPYSVLDNPTGIALKAGEIFTIIADLKGQNVSLTSIDLGIGYGKGAEIFIMKDGVNKFTASKSGLLYVKYHTGDKTGTKPNIKLNITGGTVNGYYDSQKHSEEDWWRLLDKATYKDFDVLGKYAHITFSTDRFRANTPNGKALIDQYDQLVYLEQEFMGLEKYNKMFQNRVYFHVDYPTDKHMYAITYRTAYEKNTMNLLTTLSSFKGTPWGPAHEVGHANQTRGLRWFGMQEVTNNIHSMYVQATFGNQSTLIKDNRYSQALEKFVNKGISHHEINDSDQAGIYNGVFHKLIPFWQLKLYLMDALGKKDFYKDLYELYRTNTFTVNGTSTEDGFYQLKFVENVCQVAKLDLTDFFQSWGFLTPVDTKGIMDKNTTFRVTQADIDAVKKRISEEGYKKPAHDNIYEITDNNVANYK